MENKIKVGVRIRPLSTKELGESASSTVCTEQGGKVVTFQDNKKNHYGFDWAFDSESSQRLIYDSMCKPLIDSVFQGYNATFFACK
ncbi:hypothetical protein EON65_25370 [archaeon]|nr:MAG: hypothetical protein EON65_25370 [archaeon]